MRRKYSLNQCFFDNIDTEEKAYFLGFLYADGYNQENRGTIALSLQESDYLILESFAKYLSTNKPLYYIKRSANDNKSLQNINNTTRVYNMQNRYCLQICSKYMSKQLARLGCMQKKSLILEFPTEDQVPSYLHNHFIRGYLDGDGCVVSGKNKHFGFYGQLSFLEKCQDVLVQNITLNKVAISQRKTTFGFKYGGNGNFRKVRDYIYKDATVYLNRKREKAYVDEQQLESN